MYPQLPLAFNPKDLFFENFAINCLPMPSFLINDKAIFYCCLIIVVPIKPPLLSTTLRTSTYHIKFSPIVIFPHRSMFLDNPSLFLSCYHPPPSPLVNVILFKFPCLSLYFVCLFVLLFSLPL